MYIFIAIFLLYFLSNNAFDASQNEGKFIISTPGDEVIIRNSMHIYDSTLLEREIPEEKPLETMLLSHGMKKKYVKHATKNVLAFLKKFYFGRRSRREYEYFDHNLHVSIKKNSPVFDYYSLLISTYLGKEIVNLDIHRGKIIAHNIYKVPSSVKKVAWCTNKFFYVLSTLQGGYALLCKLELYNRETGKLIPLHVNAPIRDCIPHPTDHRLCYVQQLCKTKREPVWYKENIVSKTRKEVSVLDDDVRTIIKNNYVFSSICSHYREPVINQYVGVALFQELHLPITYMMTRLHNLQEQKKRVMDKLQHVPRKKKYWKQIALLKNKEEYFIEDSLCKFAKNKKS